MDEELFFLIGINEDKDGKTVNLMTTPEKWRRLLTMARANGWRPRGTLLDVEFQLNLELSMVRGARCGQYRYSQKASGGEMQTMARGVSDTSVPDRHSGGCYGDEEGHGGNRCRCRPSVVPLKRGIQDRGVSLFVKR